MKYMLMIAFEEKPLTEEERAECYEESKQLAHDLAAKGAFLGAAPLQPSSTATTVRVRDGKRVVTDGPFAETREQFGGFFMVDASDLDEAMAIAERIPMARKGSVEIRPVIELAGMPENAGPGVEVADSRTVAAPRDLVWRAFTEKERFEKWWAPAGFEMQVTRMDVRRGGTTLYSMRSPECEMWCKQTYRDVVPGERLAWVMSFADASGATVRAPMDPNWPLEVLHVVAFSERDGRTTLTMRANPLGAVPAEQKAYAAFHEPMRQCGDMCFGQLERQLQAQVARAV
jgi:uncharacterized protein YndB with AHSA1/START domain